MQNNNSTEPLSSLGKKQLPLFDDKTALPTGKHHISYSELSVWNECSYKHKLKYVLNLGQDKPSIHTEFGQALHDALENYLLKKEPFSEALVEKVVGNFQDLCVQLGEKHDVKVAEKDMLDFSASVPKILAQVPGFMDSTFPGWETVSAEQYLYEQVENQTNKWFKGYIDGVIKIPKKSRKKGDSKAIRLSNMPGAPEMDEEAQYEYQIIDWKTTDWGWTADKKRDFNKQLQLVLYKHYFCRIMNLRLDQVKCGFALLKRKPNKSDGSHIELVQVSVGPKTEQRAMDILQNALNQIRAGMSIKNRQACRFCEFSGSPQCP